MANEVQRIQLEDGTELAALADAVSKDRMPRVLERDGKAVAVLVTVEPSSGSVLTSPTPEGIERALSVVGAWSDMDTDALKEKIYRWRHEAPPSEPVTWC